MDWAERSGEVNDSTDSIPLQCLNPVGHWHEISNLFRNGVLSQLLARQPELKYILVRNVHTADLNLEPAILGQHIESKAAMTVEVITRLDDRGGGTNTGDAD